MINLTNKPHMEQCDGHYSVGKVFVKKQVDSITELEELVPQGETLGWGQVISQIPRYWQETKGDGIKVAILDTGIDPTHPDLESGIVDSIDFTGDGVADQNGHGTHCAGIVAARENNFGMIGIAPAAELMIAKVLNNEGLGEHAWIAEGIYWAVESDADIISMSLGGEQSSPAIYSAIQYALFHGKAVICAAGNSGIGDGNTIGYPGKNGGVITVAAHDIHGNPSGFSSRGGELDFMAPGSDIWSTYKEGGYAKLSGTSMATPFVAGLSALILSKHKHSQQHQKTPIRNNEELKNHLLRLASHPNHHDNHSGYGAFIPFQYI